MTENWVILHDGPATAVEVHSFRNGKVGHVVTITHDVVQYKAFYDGIFLGAHEDADSARQTVELVAAQQPPKPLHPVPNYR